MFYSLLITFFCQDFSLHSGQRMYLVLFTWGAHSTLL